MYVLAVLACLITADDPSQANLECLTFKPQELTFPSEEVCEAFGRSVQLIPHEDKLYTVMNHKCTKVEEA